MRGASLKYTWLTYRRDALWFPLVILAVFVAITAVMRRPAIRFDIARAYLGIILPLVGGILSAYAVLDDPAIELRFAAPIRADQTLRARVGLIVAVQAVCALLFQLVATALRVDFSPLGGALAVQGDWFLPTLALAALGTAGSLAAAQSVFGAFSVGAAWLVEVMMKGWFERNAKPFYLFLGTLSPRDPGLWLNRLSLLGLSAVLLVLAWKLLHRQERYL